MPTESMAGRVYCGKKKIFSLNYYYYYYTFHCWDNVALLSPGNYILLQIWWTEKKCHWNFKEPIVEYIFQIEIPHNSHKHNKLWIDFYRWIFICVCQKQAQFCETNWQINISTWIRLIGCQLTVFFEYANQKWILNWKKKMEKNN